MIEEFIAEMGLTHTQAARLLGMSSQHLTIVRRRGKTPPYVEAHLITLNSLSQRMRRALVKERLQ